jgi:hypothetical protein
VIWGTGAQRREFLYVDDCADALVYQMKACSQLDHVNVASGANLTIRELAELIARTVGFEGTIVSHLSKPDGTPQKLMAADRLRSLGWSPRTDLSDGLAMTYKWHLDAIERGTLFALLCRYARSSPLPMRLNRICQPPRSPGVALRASCRRPTNRPPLEALNICLHDRHRLRQTCLRGHQSERDEARERARRPAQRPKPKSVGGPAPALIAHG